MEGSVWCRECALVWEVREAQEGDRRSWMTEYEEGLFHRVGKLARSQEFPDTYKFYGNAMVRMNMKSQG